MSAKSPDWDDLRFFLAVAKTGSLSGAARHLGVTHSTVFRRIGAFETGLGVRLFERLPGGYVLTAAGEDMAEAATRIEEEIAALGRRIAGRDIRLSGTLRLTTIDMLALWLLPRHLALFREEYPGIEIEIATSNAALSLTRREADIALRIGNTPPETLVGRRVGRLVFAIYATPELRDRVAAAGGGDGSHDGYRAADWIGVDSEHEALARRFERFLPGVRPVYRTNSIASAVEVARAGLGLATLPCGIADREPGLVRVGALPEEFTLDLWLLTHEDLRRTARIHAFMQFLSEALKREADLLEGRNPEAWRA